MNSVSRVRSTNSDPYCKECAGFLFSHRCGNLADARCVACGKGICHSHQRPGDGGVICVACAKQRADGVLPQAQNAAPKQYGDDPYFYSRNVYGGYGYYAAGSWGASYAGAHHRDDFTSADGESTRVEGDEGFERSSQDS